VTTYLLRIVFLSATALLFTEQACAESGDYDVVVIAHAKETVSNEMKDPNSTQFKDIKLSKYGPADVVCGAVNAKNGYGGYMGFQRFVVLDGVPSIRPPGVFADVQKVFDDIWNHLCH
jgi:hypothetical protein